MKLRLFPSSASAPAIAYPGLDLLAAAVLMLRSGPERVTYVNPAAENLFELSRPKFIGHTPRELFGECRGARRARSRKAVVSGASYTEQEIELGVGRQGQAAPHVHRVADRDAATRRC